MNTQAGVCTPATYQRRYRRAGKSRNSESKENHVFNLPSRDVIRRKSNWANGKGSIPLPAAKHILLSKGARPTRRQGDGPFTKKQITAASVWPTIYKQQSINNKTV